LISGVEDFVKCSNLEDFVIVADSGLINKTNIALLESGEYKCFIGAGIKNKTEVIKQWILSQEKRDGVFHEMQKGDSRLIIGYCDNRAKKDKFNCNKGVKRLIEMRPMFRFTPKRIEVHVCICFGAYKVYKELEHVLKLSGIHLSVDRVLNIAKNSSYAKIKLSANGETLTKTMRRTAKHRTVE
jgi:hypothetical protein